MKEATLNSTISDSKSEGNQYSFKKIILIWLLSALPMGFLAFVGTPLLGGIVDWPIEIVYWCMINVGLIWQFFLSLIILKLDGNTFDRSTIINRLKFKSPVNPKTGKSNNWLLLWVVPFILINAFMQTGIGIPNFDHLLAFITDYLPKYDLSVLATRDYKGAWWLLIPYCITFIFNYFLGEELMYRAILLPKMNGVFGKWDWFINGILFGFYHLHKPHIIVGTALFFGFVFAFPSKLFQSSWMSLIIHGLEGILGFIIIIGIILGMG
jgi:membrane protease YdiL (CAAX protease family)